MSDDKASSTFQDGPAHHGIIVALEPTSEQKALLEQPDGVPTDELHVTLAYLGLLGSEPPDLVDDVFGVLETVQELFPVLTGEVSGIGVFETSDGDVTIALPDVVGLNRLRTTLVEMLEQAGVWVSTDHGFVPHISLVRGAIPDRPDVIGVPLTFDQLVLRWGDEVETFELVGPALETTGMPYEKVRDHADCPGDEPVAVVKEGTDEVVGCHATEEGADAQITALLIAESEENPVGDPTAAKTLTVVAFAATPLHETEVSEDPFDAEMAEGFVLDGQTEDYYDAIYAWKDDEGAADDKGSYAGLHHFVAEDGTPGAASHEGIIMVVEKMQEMIDDGEKTLDEAMPVWEHLADHLAYAELDAPPALVDPSTEEDVADVEGDVTSPDDGQMATDSCGGDCDCAPCQTLHPVGEANRKGKPGLVAAATASASVSFAGLSDEQLLIEMASRFITRSQTGFADGDAAHHEDGDLEVDDETVVEIDEIGASLADGDHDWESVIIVEGLPSGDGRMVAEGALGYRDLPIPLMLQTVNAPGHDGAVVCGRIMEIERSGRDIVGRGKFDSGANGQEAKRLISEGTMRGVSADIDMVIVEFRDAEGNEVDFEEVIFGDVEAVEVLVAGRIMGATITPFPAFQEAHIVVIDRNEVAETESLVAAGAQGDVWRVRSPYPIVLAGQDPVSLDSASLVASGSPEVPVNPPLAWFQLEDGDHGPMTVYPDGRIYGLIARFGSCHIGFRDRCVQVPKNSTGYKHFRNKNVLTAEGELVATGPVFMDTVHPDLALLASDAEAHYHDTGCGVADVAVYDTAWGICVAGAVRPTATPEQVRTFRGSDVSPDWRRIDGRMEMVGLLCVNTSGFIVPSLVAAGSSPRPSAAPRGRYDSVSGELDTLVAAGMVRHDTDPVRVQMDALRAEIAELREQIRPLRAERVTKLLGQMASKAAKRPST